MHTRKDTIDYVPMVKAEDLIKSGLKTKWNKFWRKYPLFQVQTIIQMHRLRPWTVHPEGPSK